MTDLICQERADNRIGNGCPKHVALNLDRRASHHDDQRARRAPQDDGEPDECLDRREQVEREKKRGGGQQIEAGELARVTASGISQLSAAPDAMPPDVKALVEKYTKTTPDLKPGESTTEGLPPGWSVKRDK